MLFETCSQPHPLARPGAGRCEVCCGSSGAAVEQSRCTRCRSEADVSQRVLSAVCSVDACWARWSCSELGRRDQVEDGDEEDEEAV